MLLDLFRNLHPYQQITIAISLLGALVLMLAFFANSKGNPRGHGLAKTGAGILLLAFLVGMLGSSVDPAFKQAEERQLQRLYAGEGR